MFNSLNNNKHLLFGHQLNMVNRPNGRERCYQPSTKRQRKNEDDEQNAAPDSKRISLVRLERPKTQQSSGSRDRNANLYGRASGYVR